MVKGRSVSPRSLLLRVITEERKRWTRLKERADVELTALDHAENAFTAARGRRPITERGIQDAPQPG